MLDRYNDKAKFVHADALCEEDGSVIISPEDDFDIELDVENCFASFEELLPFIKVILNNISELDNAVQRFDGQKNEDETPFILTLISIPKPNFVTLEYFCTDVNSEFNAVFEYKNSSFFLREFGTVKNISDDWNNKLQ